MRQKLSGLVSSLYNFGLQGIKKVEITFKNISAQA